MGEKYESPPAYFAAGGSRGEEELILCLLEVI